MPDETVDASLEKCFSAPIHPDDDVAWAKSKIAQKPGNGAKGADATSYDDIMAIPNAQIAKLFNALPPEVLLSLGSFQSSRQ